MLSSTRSVSQTFQALEVFLRHAHVMSEIDHAHRCQYTRGSLCGVLEPVGQDGSPKVCRQNKVRVFLYLKYAYN